MPDYEDYAAARAAVANPATPAADLAQIAVSQPSLHAQLASHPAAYPGLIDWLAGSGDPAVKAAVAARRAGSGSAENPNSGNPAPGNPALGNLVSGDLVSGGPAAAAAFPAETGQSYAGSHPGTGPSGGPQPYPGSPSSSGAQPYPGSPSSSGAQPYGGSPSSSGAQPYGGVQPLPGVQPYGGQPQAPVGTQQPYSGQQFQHLNQQSQHPVQQSQYPTQPYAQPHPQAGHPAAAGRFDAVRGQATSAVSGVNRMIDGLTGHQGAAIVSFRGLFSDTFKRHSKHDIDSLLYSGTAAVAIDPQPYRLPWLYARVGGILLAAFLTLWVTYEVFYGTGNVIPGLLFTGALVVPASLMVFFWEANQARNVSIFDLIRIFFIGGAVSILLTFVIGEVLPADVGYRIGEAAFSGLLIGITEETAKGLVVVVLIRKLRGNLILNGLLIGAAVGTGFAVFETAGYGMTAWLYSGDMAQTLLIRSFLSIGSHVVWTAMAGAAFMLAQRPGRDTASINNLAWKRFLPLFGVAVALHAVWDFFAFVIDGDTVYYLLCVLIAAAWIIIVRLMNSGLRQQVLADQAGAAARPPAGFAPFGPTGLPGPVAGSGAAPLTVPPGVSGPFAAAVPGLAADRPEPVSGFGSAAQGPLAAAPAASVSPFAPAAPISPFAPAVGNMAAPVPAASVSPLVPETGNVTEPVPAAGPPWGGPTAAAPEMASPPAEPTGSAASPGTDG